VAHGDCGGVGGNRLAGAVAEAVRRGGRFAAVGVGYMRSDPPFEAVAADILTAGTAARLRVLPLLMSDGYYARQAIPQRLGVGSVGVPDITIEPPLGLHPRLPGLVADEAAATLSTAGIDAARANLLLVAHGSQKSGASAEAARDLASAVAAMGRFAAVEVAFLEERPFLADQLRQVATPACVFGLFVGEGRHGDEDLHRAVACSGRPGLVLAPALADCAGVMEMIAGAF